ncbi:MAG TPA: SRPBCC family protein [Usitatibacter sp.]|nr:SRPBCC family protein [Usitatibacter sp.]
MKNSQTLELVAQGDREIVITRDFDAPAKLVFRALAEPALVRRWMLGPGDYDMPVCDIDFRVGGSYKYLWKSVKDGSEMVLAGAFREIVPGKRIVRTERFEARGWSPGDSVGTVVLTENAGKTTMQTTMLYESKQVRDGMLKSGMKEGVAMSYDRLEEVVAA